MARVVRRWGALVAAVWVVATGASAKAEPEPRAIAEQALDAERLGFKAGRATLTMELRDRAGRLVTRTLEARTATGDGWRKMRLAFLAPVDQKGIELLVSERRGEPAVQYLWLPRSRELRRVAAGERGGGFQGSDFAFSDFEDRDFGAAVVTRLADETVGGVACYRIEVTPRPGEAGPGGWAKVGATISKDGLVPVRLDFFGADGAAKKRLEVKKVSKVDGVLTPTRLVMSDLVQGTRTTLDIGALDPAARFPDAVFEPESLGR